MKRTASFLALLALAAAPQDDRKDRLRESLHDNDLAGEWVYDDLDAGLALAKKTGKPILLVFR
jgi:hypothetical protein